MIFKCKMCGGDLDVNESMSVGSCQYCGSTMTLPRLDNDKRVNLYDRASHFRRNNEFDKAMSIYETILNEDTTDAEAYWSLVLCKYGIEYVEDPKTHKRVPTCNRTHFTSIFADEDYKQAIANADNSAKAVYEAEAEAIDNIQKGILEISSKERPFDVFICYKETDSNGKRTPDSVLAQDLYYELTEEGYKVFFSRITLEDKLGSAYEPYIFAALNSSKVMVVVGTKAEYFNSAWVKNEWGRYLALIKKGAEKNLIPAYKDMDPYDLPEEFSHLQAQDMSKLGFMQDLVRGIKKLLSSEEIKALPAKEITISGGNPTAAALLKRVFIFLEDADFPSADEYCERVLDLDPENAKAYIGKLMVKLHAFQENELVNSDEPLESYSVFEKALRYADDEYKQVLLGYKQMALDNIEKKRLKQEEEHKEKRYQDTLEGKNKSQNVDEFRNVAKLFRTMNGYKDSDVLAIECELLAEEKAKQAIEHRNEYERLRTLFEVKIKSLKDERSSLGIFSGKRKKEIDETIIKLDTKIKYIEILFSVPGDVVQFGKNFTGVQPIKWRVLDIINKKALLLSDELLDYGSYGSIIKATTWETSILRQLLNERFITEAFIENEKEAIIFTMLENNDNIQYGTKGGNETNDKVFLLSIDEVHKYIGEILKVNSSDEWWLRSPGCNSHYAAIVNCDRAIEQKGKRISKYLLIRPALWVDLSSDIFNIKNVENQTEE